MRVPECPDCGETEGLCRDVAPGTNPRLVWREIKCLNCGAKRKAFMAYLPDEFREVSFKELSADRLIDRRNASYKRRGKGAYRRTDTLWPARVSVWVQVTRFGRRIPRVGRNGWNVRGSVQAGHDPSLRAPAVHNTPLWTEEEEVA